MFDDTIAAIATPLGEGGLAVIRLSGSRALAVADQCFLPAGRAGMKPSAAPTHTVHFGHATRDGQFLDEVLLTVMRGPRTFTREDVVEISCHGGILPSKLVLDAVLAQGARLAEPGEFTRRAFLNGRIDLTQAEAVVDLIQSRTELALAVANQQLAGKLSHRINGLRDQLIEALAHIEAHLDFPEEGLSPDTRDELIRRLEKGLGLMDELLNTAGEGRILRRGIRGAIVGRPNAGKSSLLNQLLGQDRAIVSPQPGTTRDTIEETANIRGLPVIIIDTAGLREARDDLEREGIRRSRESAQQAEFILHVIDASGPLTDFDRGFLAEFAHKKSLMVLNKIDLPRRFEWPGGPSAASVEVCCLSGQGIELLKDAIRNLVWGGQIQAEMLEAMINSRHQDALSRARAAGVRTVQALRGGESLELVALDLRQAVSAVGEIVGHTTTEDLLDTIFRRFCIGK